jgi:phosphoribosylformylglycinamidine cyclo-ligase
MIQEESQTSWKEMFQVFNMGHRLEVYLPKEKAEAVIALAQSFNIDAQVVGFVEEANQNTVEIQSVYGTFTYQ